MTSCMGLMKKPALNEYSVLPENYVEIRKPIQSPSVPEFEYPRPRTPGELVEFLEYMWSGHADCFNKYMLLLWIDQNLR